jgi:hypothetical protein
MEMEGGKFGTKSFVKGLKKFGKAAAPVAKDLAMTLAKEGLKYGVKSAVKSQTAPAGGKRGRKPKMPKTMPFPAFAEGGALLRNDPAEYHSSVYPPALASYNAQMPIGSRGSGRKKAAAPVVAPVKAKRSSARGAIVAEVMKKKGLSLAEASKFVKAHGLY